MRALLPAAAFRCESLHLRSHSFSRSCQQVLSLWLFLGLLKVGILLPLHVMLQLVPSHLWASYTPALWGKPF